MDAPISLLALWGLFAATHMGLSSVATRRRLIDRLGTGPFLGLYSLVALAVFVPLVSVYLGHRHEGALLWNLRSVPGLVPVSMWVSGVCFAITVASFFQPSPASIGAGADPKAVGILRITRHPLFMPIAVLGASHTLINGYVTDVIFFLGLTVFGVVGCMHQDARKIVEEGPGFARFIDETSLVPFAAILTGRNKLVLSELPWLGIGVGAAAAVGFYHLHWVMFF